MTTLYLCGAGNVEGVRLALSVNREQRRWGRIVLLDDDAARHGRSILGVEIIGSFELLGTVRHGAGEAANLVARTTARRRAARARIRTFAVPLTPLIHANVDTMGVTFGRDILAFQNATLGADSSVGEGSVIFMGAVVGHGSRLGECCVLAPNAVVNARVQVGDDVYVGTNASVLPDLSIGMGATIGTCSAVMQDVPAGATVIGVPGRVLQLPAARTREGRGRRDELIPTGAPAAV